MSIVKTFVPITKLCNLLAMFVFCVVRGVFHLYYYMGLIEQPPPPPPLFTTPHYTAFM